MLVIVMADWDRMSDSDDDDGGHIIEEYGLEEASALLPSRDWLYEDRHHREVRTLAHPSLNSSKIKLPVYPARSNDGHK
jgi:hypothetical protein